MERVVLIGAANDLTRTLQQTLLTETDDTLVRLTQDKPAGSEPRVKIVTGQATNDPDLDQAMRGQDVVVVVLSSDFKCDLTQIIAAMNRNIVARLIVTKVNDPKDSDVSDYQIAVTAIKKSALNYTVIAPSHLTQDHSTYEVTLKSKTTSTTVDVTALARLIQKLANDPTLYIHDQITLVPTI